MTFALFFLTIIALSPNVSAAERVLRVCSGHVESVVVSSDGKIEFDVTFPLVGERTSEIESGPTSQRFLSILLSSLGHRHGICIDRADRTSGTVVRSAMGATNDGCRKPLVRRPFAT